MFVTAEKYPGEQSIGKRAARLILQRNVGAVTVVESHSREHQVLNPNACSLEQKQIQSETPFFSSSLSFVFFSFTFLLAVTSKCRSFCAGWGERDSKWVGEWRQNTRIIHRKNIF